MDGKVKEKEEEKDGRDGRRKEEKAKEKYATVVGSQGTGHGNAPHNRTMEREKGEENWSTKERIRRIMLHMWQGRAQLAQLPRLE